MTLMTYYERVSSIIALISALISIASILCSIHTYRKNKNLSKATVEQGIASRISSASAAVDEAFQSFCVFEDQSDPLSQSVTQTYNNTLRDYLKAYDEACSKYFNDGVRKKVFVSFYKDEIAELFVDPRFSELLTKEATFTFLHRFYKGR